jgi:hypothetical protein
MTEAVQTSETSVNPYKPALRYKPEDGHLEFRASASPTVAFLCYTHWVVCGGRKCDLVGKWLPPLHPPSHSSSEVFNFM